MALKQHVAPVALLLTVLVAAPLVVVAGGKKKPASAAAPTSRHDGRRLPPSPRGIPLPGHLHLLGALPHRSLASLARTHGPVLLLRLGRVPTVVVSSAAAAEEVMRAPWPSASSTAATSRSRPTASTGATLARVESFRRVREQEAARIAAWASAAAGGAAVDLSELLTEYANAVVSRAAFGDESALD
ncbi:cytochrome P450 71A1-like [Miscanthus floridulus]|uniref:cytochrome P450 71A1-like n=1 Tax=Miscanthus floridulus TaxID=154761 RepID=UPI0034580F96